MDCLFYKAKTKVITNGCTRGHHAIEQRFSYFESQEEEKTKIKKQIGSQRMVLNDLQDNSLQLA